MNDTLGFDCQDVLAHISSLNKTPVIFLKEYAEKNKMVPNYNLIHDGTFQSKIYFKYSLKLGEYEVVGDGLSKKKAKHETALNMVKKIIGDNPQLKIGFKQRDIENHVVSPFDNNIKATAILQLINICSKHKLGLPKFNLVREEGQAHAKQFTVSCQVAKIIEYATYKTKKQAKHLAAEKMMNKLMSTDTSPNESDSFKVLERVEIIKSNMKKNKPMNEKLDNIHMLSNKYEWPNTDTLDSVVEQDCQDNRLKVSDSEDVFNNIAQEFEMYLAVKEKEENISPPVFDQECEMCVAIKENGEEMYVLLICFA